DEFLEKLTSKVKKLKSGNPVNNDVFIGVLAKENLAVKLEKQLEEALKLGAKIVLGGNRTGTYFEPTIVSNITPEMAVFKEETFGPLLAVSSFTTEIEALKMSNRSNFGLGVSLFSKDIKRMESYVSKLEEGAVFINSLVKSDPRLPFGGIKSSGYGRELGEEGIRAFVNIKTVFIS
ncbi:MAG TPA: aldehyde dehydrogenase family protein, partial [Flavobacteriaceae bacterium]|nr:aldehyde dehydrogenase family protein [Flavobacteriaceae bacterium]